MFFSRFIVPVGVLSIALVFTACSSDSPNTPKQPDNSINVNLSRFPDTGDPVPDQTVLTDQWAPIGILFGAAPAGFDLIKEDFGGDTAHIFFSPDNQGAIAVFRFVEPGTSDPVDIIAFELHPWFQPGESAELVGLDESGAEVAVETVVPEDIGNESQTIKMSIQGSFRVVEWRTHGDPGIAASGLAFEF